MTARTTSTQFVGREGELQRLELAFERARRGNATIGLIGGDAGVGKTRLVEQFRRRAREGGARVLVGGCLELADGGLPYGAVTEALRGLVDDVGLPELRRLVGEDARELQRLVPALRTDLAGGEVAPQLDTSSQLRLFESLLRLVERLTADAPVVLLLEDVHWADASTRDLIVFLAHNLVEVGALVLATYRTDEMHRQHPLRPVLARLMRGDQVEVLDLEPFDRDELAQLLEGIRGETPGVGLLDAVYARSQGNAFFAEELLVAGAAGTEDLPDTLRDILLVTIDDLPSDASHVVRIMSAAGGTVRHALLARVAGLADAALDTALRAAVERGVVVADPAAGTYAFRHALMSEAVYSTLLPGELSRMHTALATHIEAEPQLATRSAAAELAHHWHAAEDQTRSLIASLEAAREAEAAAGVAEARRHVERALGLWSHVPDAAALTGIDHLEVMQWAARLCYLAGEPERATAHQEAALASADDDPARQAGMYERLGRYRWVAGDTEQAEAAYSEALRLIPPEPPSADRAHVLTSYSQILMLSRRFDDSDRYGEEALAMARAVGARAVEGHALTNLGTTLGGRGDDRGLELFREARVIAEQIEAYDDVMRSYMNEASVLTVLGRLDDAIGVAQEGLVRAKELGFERSWSAGLSSNLAQPALYLGRWDLADEVLRSAPLDAGGVGSGWAHLALASLQAARGEVAAARAALDVARRARSDTNDQSRTRFSITQLMIAGLERDTVEALAAIDARSALNQTDDFEALELRAVALRVVGDLGLAGPHDPGLADTMLAESRAIRDRLTAFVDAWMSLVEAEHARIVSGPDQADRWTAAVARCDQAGLAYHAAYARFRRAEALLTASGDRDDVADLLRSAHAAASRLQAAPLANMVADLARRARVDLGTEDKASPVAGLGLTPREIEVLMLLADGRTNPEIAERLFISRKTASVHVSNILRKLEVTTRGEAAAVAHRLHVTGSTEPANPVDR